MAVTVYEEYTDTTHHTHSTGVRATCPDCHVPQEGFAKIIRKLQASKDVYHHLLGSVDTLEKFDAKRLELAGNVWRAMKASDSYACRKCHESLAMDEAGATQCQTSRAGRREGPDLYRLPQGSCHGK